MSFLFRSASALNVGAAVAFRTLKYHRPVFNYANFATSAYGVAKTVKLGSYEKRRKEALAKLKSATEELRLRIVTSIDSMSALNGRDVQELIYTAEEKDIDLVIAALKKMELQNERMRFSSFMMDAVAMRMFSYLQLPDKAVEAFLDEELKTLFVGYNAVVILLELLYKHEMHEDVIRCIDALERRQNISVWTARGVGCFYMSSCLKVNTPEALKKGFVYYEKLLKYREPVPEFTLLALVTALKICPEKLDFLMGILQNKLRSGDTETLATYSDIKANVQLQSLITSQKLSDVEMLLSNNKCRLAKDTYDSIISLAKELNFKKPNEFLEGCKILDVTLEEWVNSENSHARDDMNKIIRRPGTFKGRQELLQ